MLSRVARTAGRPLRTPFSTVGLKEDLRALLRETAQPVAVVTSHMPPTTADPSGGGLSFHGATLSSFSSISFDPHPIVAFSLRIPSRMAASLNEANRGLPSHMVVNILSASQAPVAVRFSRPDLFPEPFDELEYSLTAEGLPVLTGCLGAVSCKLLGESWPLHDIQLLERGTLPPCTDQDISEPWTGEGVTSELFLAKVMRVEHPSNDDSPKTTHPKTLPLIYHRRGYTSLISQAPPGSASAVNDRVSSKPSLSDTTRISRTKAVEDSMEVNGPAQVSGAPNLHRP